MRWTRAALLVCVALSACRFSFIGVSVDADDMASGPADMAVGGDLPPCECAVGCSETPTHHCLTLAPTGPVTAGDYTMAGLGVYNVDGNITINTDDGTIAGPPNLMRAAGSGVINGVGFHVVTQTGGPGVGVFSVAGMTLASNATITITGANAFALASAGPVTLDGTVDASCTGMTPGPGGFAGGMPGKDGAGPSTGAGKAGTGAGGGGAPAAGGGGAGYGDAGGSGGEPQGGTPNGGVPWGDLTASNFVLVGGPGGGGGAANGSMTGAGGGGGGAVQIAVNDALTISGAVHVGGCGGKKAAKNAGGGGGGAGGAIVLEAVHVTLATSAVLAANGGGGGAGDDMSTDGTDATASVMPAIGGPAGAGAGGDGGNGGASNGMPGQHFTNGRTGGFPVPTANNYGGGGGGGVGRIAIRAQNPTLGGISDSSTAVTPDAADVNTVGQRPTLYGAANFQ